MALFCVAVWLALPTSLTDPHVRDLLPQGAVGRSPAGPVKPHLARLLPRLRLGPCVSRSTLDSAAIRTASYAATRARTTSTRVFAASQILRHGVGRPEQLALFGLYRLSTALVSLCTSCTTCLPLWFSLCTIGSASGQVLFHWFTPFGKNWVIARICLLGAAF